MLRATLCGLSFLLCGFLAPACDSSAGGGADTTTAPDTEASADLATPAPGYRVGIAQVEVTPNETVPLGGYGVGGGSWEGTRTSEGVHDPLLAVAFAVEDRESGAYLILVGLDSVGLMKPEQERVRARFLEQYEALNGAPLTAEGHLTVSSSHSHACPDTVGIYSPGSGDRVGRDEDYVDFLVDHVAEAALTAWQGRVDATLRVGRGWRDNYQDVESEANPMEMDGRVFVLAAYDEAEALLGTATVWGAHPTVLPESSRALSADWVGSFRHRMASELGGTHALLQGAVGGVYPHKPSWQMSEEDQQALFDACLHEDAFPEGWQDPDTDPDHYRMTTCVGYDVADVAIASLADAEPVATTGLTLQAATFPLENENTLFYAVSVQGFLAREIPAPNSGTELPTAHSWSRLGQLELVTVPGEAFPRYVASVRDRVVEAGAAEEDVVVLGLGDDWMGYLLLPEQYDDDAYGYHRGLSPAHDVLARQLEALDALLTQ